MDPNGMSECVTAEGEVIKETSMVNSSLGLARLGLVVKEHGLQAAIVLLLLDASGLLGSAIQLGGTQLCGL